MLHKPNLPTPHFDKASRTENEYKDPFKPPYNPSLLVAEFDTDDGSYVVLVSEVCLMSLEPSLTDHSVEQIRGRTRSLPSHHKKQAPSNPSSHCLT